MTNKSKCIECQSLVPNSLYEVNAGYCMKCYKSIIRNEAYKNSKLNEQEVILIAENYINKKHKAESVTFNYYTTDDTTVLGRWHVYFKYNYNLPPDTIADPEGFVVIVEDATGEVIK